MVKLTSDGMELEAGTPVDLVMKDTVIAPATPKRKKKKKAAAKAPVPEPATRPKKKRAPKADNTRLEDALRAWRLGEARRRGVPAFRILTDKALHAIAEQRPATAAELLAISGIGISTIEKYGQQIYRLLEQNG
jgi:DNA topoisomerase-3